MRLVLATMIWPLDVILKWAIGFLIVLVCWVPFAYLAGTSFSLGWFIAGGVVGACVNGFFEGCDLILLGLAKTVVASNPPQPQGGSPLGGSNRGDAAK